MAEKVDRLTRVNTLIQQEIARYFEKDILAPAHMLVSVTEVRSSVDLRNATVMVSIFGGSPAERSEVMQEISHRRVDIQRALARVLSFKHTPVLNFEQDRRRELGDRVLEMLGGVEPEAR